MSKLVIPRPSLEIALFLLFISCVAAQGATEMRFKGRYNGENLFLQNPLHKPPRHFCIEEIYLNDRLVAQSPRSSAIEVRFDHLPPRSEIDIRILHKNTCLPKVINPEVLSIKPIIRFLYMHTYDHKLHWKIKGEEPNAGYQVEYLNGGVWDIEATLEAGADSSKYTHSPTNFLPGVNKYRVQYISPNVRRYSSDVEILLEEKLITFTPEVVRDQMTLSERTYFEILDEKQNLLLQGEAKQIPLKRLKAGNYFIVLDGKLYPFVKR